jgi:hypothetical protein
MRRLLVVATTVVLGLVAFAGPAHAATPTATRPPPAARNSARRETVLALI